MFDGLGVTGGQKPTDVLREGPEVPALLQTKTRRIHEVDGMGYSSGGTWPICRR